MSGARSTLLATLLVLVPCSIALGQGGFGEADADEDGKITAEEMKAYTAGKLTDFDKHKEFFAALDTDKNGSLSEDEFERRMEVVQTLMQGGSQESVEQSTENPRRRNRGGRARQRAEEGALKVGDEAPVFTLKSLDGESETSLADFQGEKPVVLIFGSYT